MEYKDFVDATIVQLNSSLASAMENKIVGEYITFSVIRDSEVTQNIFAEKMCDYFEKLELISKKKFEKVLQKFVTDIEALVGQRIVKPEKKKGQEEEPECRAKKYFDRALRVKTQRQITMKSLLDFYRVMMCLYAEEIKSAGENITDFDYSMDSICLENIVEALKKETAVGVLKGKHALRFDTEELYSQDTCTFILVICLYYYMKDFDMLGE